MKRAQQGFTLIELVMVIVILGVLAAVALPKFIDLQANARDSAAQGVAAAIASGSAINYGAKKAGNASAVSVNQANVCATAVLQPLVSGVTLVDAASASTTADGKFTVLTGTTAACNGASDDGLVKTCQIQADGSGTTAQSVSVTCAK